MMSLLSFLLPLLIGLAIVLLLSTRLWHAWLLAWLAPLAGIGVCSVLFFLWSLLFFPRFQPLLYVALEGALLLALAWMLFRRRALLDLHLSRPARPSHPTILA